MIIDLFSENITVKGNLIEISDFSDFENQEQTKLVFSEKWDKVNKDDDVQSLVKFQLEWFLSLYGFESENEFAQFPKNKTPFKMQAVV